MTRKIEAGASEHYEDGPLYDHFYRRRRHDVRFYTDLASSLGSPVLELGAGTGRVSLSIARAGHDVVAVDVSREMLRTARRRLQALSSTPAGKVEWRKADLRHLRLGRRFPLVIAPFNVFMHLYERRDVEQALQTVRTHLRRGGRFVFDVLMPDLKALTRDPARFYQCGKLRDPSNGERYRYMESFGYEALRQVQLVTMFMEHEQKPEDLRLTPLTQRQFFPAELEALLHYNGFEILERLGDFDGEPLRPDSDSQVIVARARRS